VTPPPDIGGGQDSTAWVGGSNVVSVYRTRPESTLVKRPTDFKLVSEIEKRATQGLPEACRLSLDEKTSKVTLTLWVNALRAYCEEHGVDTVFHIYNPNTDSELYLLKNWGDPLALKRLRSGRKHSPPESEARHHAIMTLITLSGVAKP
jgi:hypothetical protein